MQSRPAYLANLKALSDRLIAIQQPIRILDSIKWPAQWRQDFFDRGRKTLPGADQAYYQSIPLNFDPDAKQQDLLPMGVSEGCVLKRNVPKDQAVSYADVNLPKGRLCDKLRQEQDAFFKS